MSVSAVARRHGLSPGQLFTWRRQARSQAQQDSPRMFVAAVIDRPVEPPPTRRKTITRSALPVAAIEVEVGGAVVRIASGTDSATIAAVIQAFPKRSACSGPMSTSTKVFSLSERQSSASQGWCPCMPRPSLSFQTMPPDATHTSVRHAAPISLSPSKAADCCISRAAPYWS
ncbi:transposase [Rhizobium mesoamericanum]|uniref:transposase n=1 Tax=Rhizobium mesoamericanum TaxID=1079800 RepID=UPI003CC70B8D